MKKVLKIKSATIKRYSYLVIEKELFTLEDFIEYYNSGTKNSFLITLQIEKTINEKETYVVMNHFVVSTPDVEEVEFNLSNYGYELINLYDRDVPYKLHYGIPLKEKVGFNNILKIDVQHYLIDTLKDMFNETSLKLMCYSWDTEQVYADCFIRKDGVLVDKVSRVRIPYASIFKKDKAFIVEQVMRTLLWNWDAEFCTEDFSNNKILCGWCDKTGKLSKEEMTRKLYMIHAMLYERNGFYNGMDFEVDEKRKLFKVSFSSMLGGLKDYEPLTVHCEITFEELCTRTVEETVKKIKYEEPYKFFDEYKYRKVGEYYGFVFCI